MATRADVSVVVDVLSFSTSVTVAVGRGIRVFPYRWKGNRAEDFARENDAVLALGRWRQPGPVLQHRRSPRLGS